MGTKAAEEVVGRALGEMTFTISGLTSQVRAQDLRDLSRQMRRLIRMSDQLGMVSLGQVAGDVRACLSEGDQTAFSAVWARFLRVAERSLAIETDLLDQSH